VARIVVGLAGLVVALVASVVGTLEPRALRTARLERTGISRATGDLTIIQGEPIAGRDVVQRFVRPGVVVQPEGLIDPLGGFPLRRLGAVGTRERPVVGGRTAWYGDSFTQRAVPQIAPFFADLWRVVELTRVTALQRPDEALALVVDQFRQADTIVLELVERTAFGRVSGSIFARPTVDRLLAAMREEPGVRFDGRP
jgi:hypothetical protein